MLLRSLRVISLVVLILTFLSVFAFSIKHILQGGRRFGALTRPILHFTNFPGTVMNVYSTLTDNVHLVEIDPNFKPINQLDYDVFALNGHYENPEWVIRMMNLRNDSIMHEWFLSGKQFSYHDRDFSNSEPREPILLADKSIIVPLGDSYNLYRLDKDSRILWHNTDFRFHHALNLGHDGSLWTCTKERVYTAVAKNKGVEYIDDAITNIDIESGKVKFTKSLSEALFENGYGYLIHGIGNEVTDKGSDPLHLNDVEPVLEDGTYWKRGDVFLSLRHRSLILLYRPTTNEILRVIQGPFFNQHDVDIQSDSTISLFNNHVSSLVRKDQSLLGSKRYVDGPANLNSNSQVLIYNLKDSTFISYLDKHFQNEKIMTETEGLHHILSNGDLFIESQNNGLIYILNKDEVLIRKYYNNPSNNRAERSHWVRLLEVI